MNHTTVGSLFQQEVTEIIMILKQENESAKGKKKNTLWIRRKEVSEKRNKESDQIDLIDQTRDLGLYQVFENCR